MSDRGMLTKEIEQKLIKGEIVILERKRCIPPNMCESCEFLQGCEAGGEMWNECHKETTEQITLTKEKFREFIGYQDNQSIMEDCFILLANNQLFIYGNYYRLIHGKKLVVDIFEEYSQFYIDAINDNIEQFGIDGE